MPKHLKNRLVKSPSFHYSQGASLAKVQVWTWNAPHQNHLMKLGCFFRDILDFEMNGYLFTVKRWLTFEPRFSANKSSGTTSSEAICGGSTLLKMMYLYHPNCSCNQSLSQSTAWFGIGFFGPKFMWYSIADKKHHHEIMKPDVSSPWNITSNPFHRVFWAFVWPSDGSQSFQPCAALPPKVWVRIESSCSDVAWWEVWAMSQCPPGLPSCKLTGCYGKSPFFMGKLTISMAIFNSKLLVYQRLIMMEQPHNWKKMHFPNVWNVKFDMCDLEKCTKIVNFPHFLR